MSYPLRLVFIETTFDDNVKVKAGVSVSKRHFKNAVDRNRIKRLMTQYALMILYIGKDGTEFDAVNEKMNQLFEKFLKETSTED